jgi:2-amino-4-hydroxy-6-hydroxymethyldihydropteridine diphosphokinase
MTSNNPDTPMPALIGLGANIPSAAGTPAKTFHAALAALAKAGIEITAVSPFYETQAWPDPTDPPFLNAVAGRVLDDGPVILPHPRMAERRFVLEPLQAVAPDWQHPVSGLDVDTMLAGPSDRVP